MNTNFSGLGDNVLTQAPVLNPNPVKPVTLTPTTTAPKPTVWDTINKGLNVLQTGANVYSTVKGSSSGSSSGSGGGSMMTTTQNQPGSTPPPTPTGMSTTTKVLIGTGIAGVLGTAIYFATKKKKKG